MKLKSKAPKPGLVTNWAETTIIPLAKDIIENDNSLSNSSGEQTFTFEFFINKALVEISKLISQESEHGQIQGTKSFDLDTFIKENKAGVYKHAIYCEIVNVLKWKGYSVFSNDKIQGTLLITWGWDEL